MKFELDHYAVNYLKIKLIFIIGESIIKLHFILREVLFELII